jgi:type I site-specific restriction endonuclease
MNETQTCSELIDPKLKQSGWGTIEDSKISEALRKYQK